MAMATFGAVSAAAWPECGVGDIGASFATPSTAARTASGNAAYN